MVCGKKSCPQERNLREIYTENTMFCLLSVFWCCFCLHITEYEQIRGGGAKFSWAQGHKIHKYGPGGHDTTIKLLFYCALQEVYILCLRCDCVLHQFQYITA
jgi:hypothetical protein